ncbi:MAG: hypothetical protein M5R40_17900 [Anaerolineae bacterium]|nr:hypothetical protein [Anaerolineae bacterium]
MADVERATRFLDFLVAYNHDFRTPLNSIIGFSRVILKGIDGPINDVQAEDLTSVHDGGQQLLAMFNEVIDMAKLETGACRAVAPAAGEPRRDSCGHREQSAPSG